ncbi:MULTISPECIES: hypothetical protein [unclassified Janthinobacterium]|uniref:hypothetical protein n=1 Tax=unclassified Janthinobacterium TaxID=2610881 RepID=UPI00160B5ACC|nr:MULTISPECIES: hypothetical protein [unclassified Janthinobacterium]MBB5367396.1 hypothetical protein [Janthinobacterium sp. K2C7]MBB5380126.1 hypothetical protein [Janthinobacterium sp. K2Li3]MBB5385778.1 hypothetical protein [Janthinobacterium sp. K2E3]
MVAVNADGQFGAATGGQGVELGQQWFGFTQGIELHRYVIAGGDAGPDGLCIDIVRVLYRLLRGIFKHA